MLARTIPLQVPNSPSQGTGKGSKCAWCGRKNFLTKCPSHLHVSPFFLLPQSWSGVIGEEKLPVSPPPNSPAFLVTQREAN